MNEDDDIPPNRPPPRDDQSRDPSRDEPPRAEPPTEPEIEPEDFSAKPEPPPFTPALPRTVMPPAYDPPAPPPERPYEEPLFGRPQPSRASFDAFGEPDIPMPGEHAPPPPRHKRGAQRNLDLDLSRIKREKRFGFFSTIIGVLFIAFVFVPVTWVVVYRFAQAPMTVLMLVRAGEGENIAHRNISINDMSPHIVRAVIAAEDARFCEHDGFDIEAIQEAMRRNAEGGNIRGASTISQQVAKNLFLWPERSWLRKGFETYFTALIEFVWPKRRIMEAYLNAAEWGDGIFGIEAAAQARFGVSAADLTALQAARLAAVLPSPNRWNAANPGPYVRRRSASIVGRARVVQNEGLASCVLALDANDR